MEKQTLENQKTNLTNVSVSYNSGSAVPVWLVGAGSGPATGISRYARSLGQALSANGQAVNLAGSNPPPVPSWLVKGASRAGFDLKSFFTTYPLTFSVKSRPGGSHGLLH